MAEDKTRVDFNAPESLVERADRLAEVLDISRTRLLIDALREEIDERLADEDVQQRLRDGYYRGQLDFETVEALLGTEEAMRLQLLRASLDRELPEPTVEGALPTQAAFYRDPPSSWIPDDETPAGDDSASNG